jgi:hypothetical protein
MLKSITHNTANRNPDAEAVELERFHRIVRGLNGEMKGKHKARCLCPAHDDHDPSLDVKIRNGKCLVACGACAKGAVYTKLKEMGLWWGSTKSPVTHEAPEKESLDEEEAEQIATARRILRLAQGAPRDGRSIDYLRSRRPIKYYKGRGIKAPKNALLLPRHATYAIEGMPKYPAAVLPMIGSSGLPKALHLTFLTRDGTKNLRQAGKSVRLIYGKARGTHIPLGRPFDADRPGIIGEAPEKAIAASMLTGGLPAIAVASAIFVPDEVPPCSELIIAADNDRAGRAWADEVARKFKPQRKVRIAIPPNPYKDWDEALCDPDSDHEELANLIRDADVYKGKGLPTLQTVTAHELQDMDYPEIKYVVPGYIVEGLTILASKPKVGKSWLVLDIGIAIATGGEVLGVKCERGEVLYAALEDGGSLRRTQSRIKKLIGDRDWPARLHLIAAMPRLNEGSLDFLKAWVSEVAKPRLIIIDIFKNIRSEATPDKAQRLYDIDYDSMTELRTFAADRNIAVVLVHHLRKQESDEDALDTVSGSLGLTGAADTTLVIRKNGEKFTLYGRGRDIAELEKAVQFDGEHGTWTVLGNAAEVHVSNQRKAIVDFLRSVGKAQTPREIANGTEMKTTNIWKLLRRMLEDKEVVQKSKYGTYELP